MSLTTKRIEELASASGVRKNAVLNFLCTVDANRNEREAIQNLEADARMYKWNLATKRVIRKGIKEYFS